MISAPKTTPVRFKNYRREEFPKKGVVWHHTVSLSCLHYKDGRPGYGGDIASWEGSKFPLGTAVLVDADGEAYSAFSSRHWANHIGVPSRTFKKFGLPNINRALQRSLIGIEFMVLGPVEPAPDGNGYWTAVKAYQKSRWIKNVRIPEDRVVYFPEKVNGYHFYEKLTDAQIETGIQLTMYWAHTYGFPLDYNEDMFFVSKRALSGMPGVWAHGAFREDKCDVIPQPEIIAALKNMKARYDALVAPPEPPEIPQPAPIPLVYTQKGLDDIKSKDEMSAFLQATSGIKF